MGKPGPPRTPTKILKARGSWLAPAREKLNTEPEPVPILSVPPAPHYFTGLALECWRDTAASLIQSKVLADTDLRCLECYCVTYAAWRECKEPELKLKLRGSMARDERKLGLSPGDRASVQVVVKKDDKDSKSDKFFGGMKIAK